jgi:hypothetical protein
MQLFQIAAVHAGFLNKLAPCRLTNRFGRSHKAAGQSPLIIK